MRILCIILSVILLTSCASRFAPSTTAEQSGSPVSYRVAPREKAPRRQASAVIATDTEVHYSKDQVTLVLSRPDRWKTLATDYGIIMGENFASVETAGILEDLLVYASIIPIADTVAQDENLAYSMLNSALTYAVEHQNTVYSEVRSFNWDGYDAAYYVATNDEGNTMFVVGVAVPDQGVIVTCTLSAPYKHHHRISEMLPTLFNSARVNTVSLSHDPFEKLIEELSFPQPPRLDRPS